MKQGYKYILSQKRIYENRIEQFIEYLFIAGIEQEYFIFVGKYAGDGK